MKQLTELFGSHLEYIGESCETDERITQNPAFSRMVQLKDESKICIVDKHGSSFISSPVEISNIYAGNIQAGSERKFYLQGQPILTITPTYIVMCQDIKAGSDHFEMVKFHVDEHGNLHVRTIVMLNNEIEIENFIYDEHGVELQRDTLSDDIPKSLKKVLAASIGDSAQYAKTLHDFFLQYKFVCSLGQDPIYIKSKKTTYLGYKRDKRQFEFVHTMNTSGLYLKERLDISDSPATMSLSLAETYRATPQELAKSIALEENEETRNALIGYCASRGVTKEMVAGIGLDKK